MFIMCKSKIKNRFIHIYIYLIMIFYLNNIERKRKERRRKANYGISRNALC